MSTTLFSIANQYTEFRDKMIQQLGELTEDDETSLVEIGEILTKKTDSVVRWSEYINDEIERLKNEIEVLKGYLSQMDNANTKYESYIINCMKKLEVKEIEGEEYTIKLKKPLKKVDITNEKEIPLEYITTETKTTCSIDKRSLSTALKNGEVISGACLIDGKESVKFARKKPTAIKKRVTNE